MNDETKRCKTCKETYDKHARYILDGSWTDEGPASCNRFQLMSNLELLEWEYEKTQRETPTIRSLK